jgi:hypothetical protein
MTTIALRNLGRLGNQMFRYAFARALAEQNGYELRTEPWVGESIFTLDGLAPKRPDGSEDIVIEEYRQAQKDLIYSRADCRRWFTLKPHIQQCMIHCHPALPVVHLRRGDYKAAGYPIVSERSVEKALTRFDQGNRWISVSDDLPGRDPRFVGELSMLPDFMQLMRARVLFRANSSFSWWAATLGTGRVFSPIITGFRGGVEHDNIPYVEGNWPRLAELPGITDLHLRET